MDRGAWGYGPWGYKESDMTEYLILSLHILYFTNSSNVLSLEFILFVDFLCSISGMRVLFLRFLIGSF